MLMRWRRYAISPRHFVKFPFRVENLIMIFQGIGRYQRKSTIHSWSEENMKEAIKAVQEKKMGWLIVSKTFNVPSTLRRRAIKSEG